MVTKDVPPKAVVAGNPARIYALHRFENWRWTSELVLKAFRFWILVTPHLELEQELIAVFRKALRTAGFIGGPMVGAI